jgi:hypothetical protein
MRLSVLFSATPVSLDDSFGGKLLDLAELAVFNFSISSYGTGLPKA